MILDTSALIDLLRGNEMVIAKLKELEQQHIPLFLTSISVFELWQHADVYREKKLKKIHELLESLGVFIFDISAAKEAGSIHATLKEEGLIIDPEDSMIAGIVNINNETILTRNIKHFERIPHLRVESY